VRDCSALANPLGPVRLFAILLVLNCSYGCANRPRDATLRYIQLSVALGEHDPDALDYYYGPEDWVAEIRAHPPRLNEIRQQSIDLAESLKAGDFLRPQLQAIAARAELLQGKRRSFEDEARAFFDLEIPTPPVTSEIDGVRRELNTLLPGKGTLAERYAAFDAQFTIPAERVPAVMERAVAECRDRTLQHLKLPREEGVTTEYVTNRPWNAFSSYKGHFHSVISINSDFPLTIDRALQLACHETYPGHHAYNTFADSELVQHRSRYELMVQPTFSPQSFASEAIATNAVDLAFSDEDRFQFEREVLFPLAGLALRNLDRYLRANRLVDQLDAAQPEIARGFLEGRLEWTRAASQLEDQVLMVRSDATLKYLNEFRTYMLTYTIGKQMVRHCYSEFGGADRWRLFQRLMLGEVSLKECAQIRQDSLDKFSP
jgi:hypothetical protein